MARHEGGEASWLDDAFSDGGADGADSEKAAGPEKEFDWIDDAFDETRTARDIAEAKGPKALVIALAVVLVAAAALVMVALAGIAAVMR